MDLFKNKSDILFSARLTARGLLTQINKDLYMLPKAQQEQIKSFIESIKDDLKGDKNARVRS